MVNKSNKTLEKVYCGILIFCGIGLLLSLVGITFEVSSLYYTGLVIASPLFIIVLPACLLLLALFPVGCLYGIFRWIKKKFKNISSS
jgi:uncharacterized membrane protein